jgi:hypothetical protein
LVVLSAITVYGLSKKWFPFGSWLYYRSLLFKIYQRSGSRLVVGCIISHYCLRFIKEVVPFWWLVILSPLLFKIYQRSGSRLVVGYIVGIYCLRFIKEVVPVW